MANKYIRDGATYNGDGTSPDLATSDGGVGAWNNFYDIFTGTAPTYGSLNDGDVVYIRTKNESGNDLSYNHVDISIGKSGASEDNPVVWVFDDGDVWNGVSGTVTFHKNTTGGLITVLSGNIIRAKNYNLVFDATSVTTSTSNKGINIENAMLIDVKIDWSYITGNYGPRIQFGTANNQYGSIINCIVKSANRYQGAIKQSSYSANKLVGCKFELSTTDTDPLFLTGNYGSYYEVIGGSISGTTSYAPVAKSGTTGGATYTLGLIFPTSMKLNGGSSSDRIKESVYNAVTGGTKSGYVNTSWGQIDNLDSYPYLNAVHPDSAGNGFSFRIYPEYAKKGAPVIANLAHFYTDDASTKTITLEWLSNNGMSTPTKDVVYMIVEYKQDSDGKSKVISTYDPAGGTCDTSSETWSTTSYGGRTFTARKLSITTPTAIKKDTIINIIFVSGLTASSSSDVYFIDPDVKVT